MRERISRIQPSASRGFCLSRAASPSTIARTIWSCWLGGIARAAAICSGVGPGMAAVAVGRRPAGSRPARSIRCSAGDRGDRVAHLRLPGRAGRRLAQQRDEIVDRAAMVAAEVLQRREIVARLRVAGLELERAPEQPLGLGRRRVAAGEEQRLAEIGGIIGIARG